MKIEIKALEEYGSVRDAYDEQKRLLEKLAEVNTYIAQHPAGAEFVRAEEGKEFDSTIRKTNEALAERGKRFRRSLNILDSIETRIGKIGELYRESDKDDNLNCYSNAPMAIAHHIVGREDIAQRIIKAMEAKKIEPDLTLSIYYQIAGNKEKADRLTASFDLNKDGELYYFGKEKEEIYSYYNATMSLFSLLQGDRDNAERILAGIDSRIGFDKDTGSYYHMQDKKFWNVPATATISCCNLLLGNGKAEAILNGMKDYFIKKERNNGELIARHYNGSLTLDTLQNAWMAITYALMDGARMCGLPKE